MALDNLLVTDARGKAYEDARLRKRLASSLDRALRATDEPAPPAMDKLPSRQQAFRVAPRVLVSDKASSRTTVVEVNARDRPGLLARLAQVIHGAGHQLHSAHIATYGERAVDVFYLTGADGKKLSETEGQELRTQLLTAAAAGG
jgi:[protein-PII] uridylyltransferase